MFSMHLDLKVTFSLQDGKSLSIVQLSLALKSSESLPKYVKAKVNFRSGTMTLRSFLMKWFIQRLFNTLIHEVLGIIIVLEYWF